MKLRFFACIIANVIMVVLGQTLFKIGIEKEGFAFSISQILRLATNIYIVAGLIIYIFSMLIWFYVLSKVNLSIAYPMQSLCYVLMAIISVFFFKEQIKITGIAGLVFIIFGVVLTVL